MIRFLLAAALTLNVFLIPSFVLAMEHPAAQAQTGDERKARDEQSMEERFRKLGRDLDELNARAQTMEKQTRKEIDRHLADAEKKRAAAEQKLEALQAAGKKKWDAFARDLDAALDEFEQAYERARKHFKE